MSSEQSKFDVANDPTQSLSKDFSNFFGHKAKAIANHTSKFQHPLAHLKA